MAVCKGHPYTLKLDVHIKGPLPLSTEEVHSRKCTNNRHQGNWIFSTSPANYQCITRCYHRRASPLTAKKKEVASEGKAPTEDEYEISTDSDDGELTRSQLNKPKVDTSSAAIWSVPEPQTLLSIEELIMETVQSIQAEFPPSRLSDKSAAINHEQNPDENAKDIDAPE